MKKILFAAAAILAFQAVDANAMYLEVSPYVGLDYSFYEADFKDGRNSYVEDDYNALGISAGVMIEKYLGLEAYIQKSGKESRKSNYGKYTGRFWSMGVDLLGYVPVYQDLDLIAGIGIGDYTFRIRHAGYKTHKDTAYGTRLTFGAQYNLDYNWGVRATYRYVSYSNSDTDDSSEYTVGLRYSF